MELLIFIALVVIFFLVLNIQSNQRSNADGLKKDLSILNKQIQDLKNQFSNLQPTPAAVKPAEELQKEKEAADLLQVVQGYPCRFPLFTTNGKNRSTRRAVAS